MEVSNNQFHSSFVIEGQKFRMVLNNANHKWELYKGEYHWKAKPIMEISKAKGKSFLDILELLEETFGAPKKPSKSSRMEGGSQ